MDTIINGAKTVFPACIILIFAWTLSSLTGELGAAEYIISLIGESFPMAILPLIIFVLSCLMAFAMGTSWGTMGIVTPLSVPVAYKMGQLAGVPEEAIIPTIVIPALAAVLTGAIFGDHCSPISDTTILSSTGAGADHIDHVRTQIPYAVTGAVVAAVFGFIPAGLGLHPAISIVLGIAVLVLFIKYYGKPTGSAEEIKASQ